LIDGVYVVIPNETLPFYTADHGGDYRVEVYSCPNCDELFWDFHIEPTNIKTFVETVDLCSYKVCISTKADFILNITVIEVSHLHCQDNLDVQQPMSFEMPLLCNMHFYPHKYSPDNTP